MTLIRAQNIAQGMACIFFGLFLIAVVLFTGKNKRGTVRPNDLKRIQTRLLGSPEISHDSRNNYDLTLRVEELPGYVFINSKSFYAVTKARAFCSDVRLSDTVIIGLLNEEYEEKVLKTKPVNLFQRIIDNQKCLSFYSLVLRGNEYVNLNLISNSQSAGKSNVLAFLAVSMAIVFGIKTLKLNTNSC